MSNLTDYAEKLALDFLMNTQSATRPTSWFLALHTGAPGETGGSNELATGSNYARQTSTWVAAASGAGSTTNSNTITFGPSTTSNWGTISSLTIWDNGTIGAGNCLWQGNLSTARVITVGDSLQFAAGAISLTLA
jgi:hypothetical protein